MAKTIEKNENGKGWAIRLAGSNRVAGSYRTQNAAIKAAETLSRKSKGHVVIYERRPAKRSNPLVIGDARVSGRSRPRTARVLKRDPATMSQLTRVRSSIPPRTEDLARPNSRYAVNKS